MLRMTARPKLFVYFLPREFHNIFVCGQRSVPVFLPAEEFLRTFAFDETDRLTFFRFFFCPTTGTCSPLGGSQFSLAAPSTCCCQHAINTCCNNRMMMENNNNMWQQHNSFKHNMVGFFYYDRTYRRMSNGRNFVLPDPFTF